MSDPVSSASEPAIKGLHHNAYRCRDSEETRQFYEDFLGLPLAATLELGETKTGRSCSALHTFYRMQDGSFMAFFEVPDSEYDFKDWHDFDLHIALEVDHAHLLAMKAKGEAEKREVRGVADHGFIQSIYFRDPNGYVIELTAVVGADEESAGQSARAKLDNWQATKHAHA